MSSKEAERLDQLERRVAALESSPCRDGHDFLQVSYPVKLIYCRKCGTQQPLGEQVSNLGFRQ